MSWNAIITPKPGRNRSLQPGWKSYIFWRVCGSLYQPSKMLRASILGGVTAASQQKTILLPFPLLPLRWENPQTCTGWWIKVLSSHWNWRRVFLLWVCDDEIGHWLVSNCSKKSLLKPHVKKKVAHNISKNYMVQCLFVNLSMCSQSVLLRYMTTPFAKAISIGPFISNVRSLKHWVFIYSTQKNEALEESEVSTFFIRRSHSSFESKSSYQSSNPSKPVGQAAVLKNRELDSVGAKIHGSWAVESF